jgi:F-type H+-transporting ATPase subunit b
MDIVLKELGSLGFDPRIALANTVNFLIIFFLLKHFFFGKIGDAIKTRRLTIEKGLHDAKEAAEKLKGAETSALEVIKEAHLKGSSLVKESEERAKVVFLKKEEEATKKAGEIIENAHSVAQKIKKDGEEELSKQAPILVASLLEKVLREKSSPQTNEDFVKKSL